MTAQSAIAYWNGAYLPLDQVSVSPLDRGFLFADGVYEVVAVYNGRLFRAAEHLQRLANSLAGIELEARDHDWPALLACIVERNGGGDLSVYLQVTRGAPAVRDHGFPSELTPPTVFAMAKPLKPLSDAVLRAGLTAITMPDIRWGACHLKTIALLPNVLARQRALAQGAADAILVRDGYITETSAGNVFLVRDGTLYTPRKDHRILPGITRDVILELAAAHYIPVREEDLSSERLAAAEEVWMTSTTREVVAITRINSRVVGNGRPGPLWRRIWDLFQAYKREVCPAI